MGPTLAEQTGNVRFVVPTCLQRPVSATPWMRMYLWTSISGFFISLRNPVLLKGKRAPWSLTHLGSPGSQCWCRRCWRRRRVLPARSSCTCTRTGTGPPPPPSGTPRRKRCRRWRCLWNTHTNKQTVSHPVKCDERQLSQTDALPVLLRCCHGDWTASSDVTERCDACMC